MAKGILAMFGGKPKGESGESGESDDSDDGEPASVKVRAVRDMFRAADEKDWDAAAKAFHRAYVECSKKAEAEDSGDDGDEEESDSEYEE